MKKLVNSLALAVVVLSLSAVSFGAPHCDAPCEAQVPSIKVRCPTPLNPGKKCTVYEPNLWAACKAHRDTTCKLWDAAVNFFSPLVKVQLGHRYNAASYNPDRHDDYVADCTGAATATIAVIGAQVGGVYGGLASGAVGLFVAKRICIQSTKW